jgi:hypothetical protein
MPIDGWWITGMMDGEGSFVAGLYADKRGSQVREQLVVQFRLAQRADDADVALKLFEYFRCGKMNFEERVNPNPRYVFQLTSKEDLEVLIAHLDRFPLQSKKARDYEIWLPIARVFMQPRGVWLKQKEWVRAQCEALKAVRAFAPAAVDAAKAQFGGFLFRGGKRTWRFFGSVCSTPGCTKVHYAKGLCRTCQP